MVESIGSIIQTDDHLSRPSTVLSLNGLTEGHCRICLESGHKLIQPCGCRGTVGYVHSDCLKIWIERKEQVLYLQSLSKGFREIDCEICQRPITYQASTIRQLSTTEFSRKFRKFPAFFIVHTAFLLLLMIIMGVLTHFLRRVIDSDEEREEKVPPIVIESCCLAILIPTFIKSVQLWIRDYFLSDRIVVTNITPAQEFYWSAN